MGKLMSKTKRRAAERSAASKASQTVPNLTKVEVQVIPYGDFRRRLCTLLGGDAKARHRAGRWMVWRFEMYVHRGIDRTAAVSYNVIVPGSQYAKSFEH